MKVIGICGSPRGESNTEYYIRIVLTTLNNNGIDTEFITLRDKNIEECTGCYHCVKERSCIIYDDFQGLFKKMVEADGILLGSPVYHSSITPKLKCLLDRAGFLGRWTENDIKSANGEYNWKGTAFSGKVVAPIAVARRAGHAFTFAQLLLWATVNDCIVVGSNYWNVGVAGKGGNLDADSDLEGISIMKHLGENIAHIIKQLNK